MIIFLILSIAFSSHHNSIFYHYTFRPSIHTDAKSTRYRQHIQKLKRKEGGGATPAGTPAATPASKGGRKRKADTPGPDTGTPTKKRGRKPKA